MLSIYLHSYTHIIHILYVCVHVHSDELLCRHTLDDSTPLVKSAIAFLISFLPLRVIRESVHLNLHFLNFEFCAGAVPFLILCIYRNVSITVLGARNSICLPYFMIHSFVDRAAGPRPRFKIYPVMVRCGYGRAARREKPGFWYKLPFLEENAKGKFASKTGFFA